MPQELATIEQALAAPSAQIVIFEDVQRIAKAYAASSFVPQAFQNNIPNCIIAVSMAHRLGAETLAVMQNLHVIHGKPGWSATFIISCINSCGRFTPLLFDVSGEGDEKTCFAFAVLRDTGDTVSGPPVSIAMAKKEGWHGKNGSKWQSMPELMLRYRAATFFGRLYCPEILMGMRTQDELEDMKRADARTVNKPNFEEES